jgi:hypothetical protein
MPTKRPRTPPKRRTKTPVRKQKRSFAAPRPERNPDQPIPETARVFATNIVKRLWPSLYPDAIGALPIPHTTETRFVENA